MRTRTIPVLALLLAGGLGASGCAHDEHGPDSGGGHAPGATHGAPAHDGDAEGEGHEEQRIVRLAGEGIEEFGIEILTAGPAVIESRIELPGEVLPNADRLAHLVPRFDGIVTEVRANLGEEVERGQVLALVESDQSLAPFEVRTLIAGTVIDKHITLGEAVSRDRDVFVVADLSSVWIDLTVYQGDLGRVNPGLKARLFLGHDPTGDMGTITYVTPVVDEVTRTATARLELPNDAGRWRPGMFVTAEVVVDEIEVPLAVPRSAIHTIEDDTVVFVQTHDGFRPQPVRLGRSGGSQVEIRSGLSSGERYVGRGGFVLKAELGKAAFGDGHGH